MLSLADNATVYLACGSTDMRKSIDGLAALVTHTFELDPFSQNLFDVEKVLHDLPLEEQHFASLGIFLSRQTLANWVLKGADWLEPLYDRMRRG